MVGTVVQQQIMTADIRDGVSPFPRHDINPVLKKTPEWNLMVAQAIWGGQRYNHDSGLFFNDRFEYRRNLEYALGREPQANYDAFLGITADNKDMPWAKGMDREIKNYITKRINILVSKVTGIKYDVEIDNMNPMAVNAKEDYKARYGYYVENKEFFDKMSQEMGINVQEAIGEPPPGGKRMPELPEDADDIEMFFENDYKTLAEIGIELGVEHHLKRLKYDRMRATMVFNAIVFGVGGLYAGMDENIMPYIENVDPGEMVIPFPPDGDFAKLPYVAQVMWVTGADFRKMACGYLEDKVIDDIIQSKSLRPENAVAYNYIQGRENLIRSTDVNRIPILRYNYRSVDTIVRVMKPDDEGNQRLYSKDVDYYSRPKEAEKLENGVIVTPDGRMHKIYRKDINTVYEGYWVINSDVVFRQGPRAVSLRKMGALGEDPMGFKIYAPNSRNGILTPLLAQCIPTLKELQKYSLKLQQIVHRAIPKGGFIDLYAIRKASLKWNNKELTDQQKVEMFLQTGWSLFTSKDRFQPGNNYKPFMEAENGMAKDAMTYIALIQNRLMELDDIMGLNQVSSAQSLSPEMGKGVAEQQVAATDVALDWLYDFDRHILEDTVETIAITHIKSVKYGPKDYYNRILGAGITAVIYSDIPFDSVDMGINISVRPTEAEWADVYRSAEKAYDKQILTFSQLLFLREIQSIKQARRYLAKCEKKATKQAQESQLSLMQKNADVQKQSLQAKAEGELVVEREKIKGQIALEGEKRKTLSLQFRLQTQMYIAIEQAKLGLLPNMTTPVTLPLPAETAPALTPQVNQGAENDALLTQLQQSGVED
jgi:hypothetical protein